jgi:hypothetical protein
MKKEKVFIIAQIVEISFLLQTLNLIAELVGHHSHKHYQALLKLKLTILLAWKELNIIVLNVVHITDMFLMMDQENQERDFAATVCV